MRRAIGLASAVTLVFVLGGAAGARAVATGEQAGGDPAARASVSVETPTSGKCTITGTAQADHLHGTPGDDVICARGGADVVTAGRGNDIVYGGRGRDDISGGPGDDVLYGGQQGDFLNAGMGDDRVYGGPGPDYAGSGGKVPCCGDFRTFDGGVDLLSGGRGDDKCLYVADGSGNDTALGGPGWDGGMWDEGDRHALEGSNGEGCPG